MPWTFEQWPTGFMATKILPKKEKRWHLPFIRASRALFLCVPMDTRHAELCKPPRASIACQFQLLLLRIALRFLKNWFVRRLGTAELLAWRDKKLLLEEGTLVSL